MADDNFRAYRSRDALARDATQRRVSGADDPLAELARLIGQSDPHGDARRADAYHPGPSGGEAAADEGYGEDDGRADDRYAAPSVPASYPSDLRGYESEPPTAAGRYFAGTASQFNGFRDDREDDYRSEQAQLPAYAHASAGEQYESDAQAQDESEAYPADDYADDYYDEPARPRRRRGVVVVMAVFALAVVGSAAAFGYRAMFGGTVLPTLPPIIKASSSPNKIVPNNADAQAGNPGQTAATSTEKLVSREEQPVNVEPPNVPRVVSTIPIVSGQSGAQAAAGAPSSAPSSPWPNPPPSGSPWPNPPATLGTQPGNAPPAPTAQTAPQQSAPPAQPSTEPKRIHTVVVRTDQADPADVAAAAAQPQQATPPAPAAAPRSVTHPTAAPRQTAAVTAPPTGGSAPLSIVPGGQHDAAATPPPVHARATAPTSVASAGPVNGAAAPSSAGGGYAVQVTSQRSEAEAQTAFRELRAKFPNQLGGREPIIRRADLGAKGTYYRALVGPFASMEEAAGMCSGLKAAGGNCLVQRN